MNNLELDMMDVHVNVPVKVSGSRNTGNYTLEVNGVKMTVQYFFFNEKEDKYKHIYRAGTHGYKNPMEGDFNGQGGYYFHFYGIGSDNEERTVGSFKFANEKDRATFVDEYRKRVEAAKNEYLRELQSGSDPSLSAWATKVLNMQMGKGIKLKQQ